MLFQQLFSGPSRGSRDPGGFQKLDPLKKTSSGQAPPVSLRIRGTPFLGTIVEKVFYGFLPECTKTFYMNKGHVFSAINLQALIPYK